MEKLLTNKNPLILLVVAVIGAGAAYYFGFDHGWEKAACTLEAKQCPDGSYVGRTGPNCEFTKCPETGWKTFIDPQGKFKFQYPQILGTTYIQAFDWPPQAQILNETFSCTEAGSETGRAGKTERKRISNREYCVTTIVEGAAGSIYTQYAYAFTHESKVVILTFSTRAQQCGNYDTAKKSECEGERATFNIDDIVHRIASTLELI